MILPVLVAIAGLAGLVMTRHVAKHASGLGLVQSPNERSSHSTPTPSGGGIAIALATLLAGLGLVLAGAHGLFIPLLLLGIIAALGLWDDLRDVSPAIRIVLQFAVVMAFVTLVGPLPEIGVGEAFAIGGMLLGAMVVVAGLWWVNLFNFMDGIDGLAGSQALLYLAGLILIWVLQDGWTALNHPVMGLCLLTFAATAGFLRYNWPPARIFMGDAGSNFLALTVLFVALTLLAKGVVGFSTVIALTSVFLSDATMTLLRRLFRGERPWRAHRRHAYQQLSRRFQHRNVTLGYAGLTLLWAAPAAVATIVWPGQEWLILAVAVLPLCLIALWCGAGASSDHRFS